MNDLNLTGLKRFRKWHDEDHKKLLKDFPGLITGNGLITFHPGNYNMKPIFVKYQEKLYNFKFREDDVVILTFPKCGTTWAQEVVWTMRHNPNFDNPMADLPINIKAPFLDSDVYLEDLPKDNDYARQFKVRMPDKDPNDGMMIQLIEVMPEKRVIKTHLPFSFYHPSMLDKCKVIFVSRNPYDALTSYYHHSRLSKEKSFAGSFDDFINYYIEDKISYGPFWQHVGEVLDCVGHPNLLCLKYEDMIADNLKEIRKIDQFIGTDLTENQMEKIKEHTTFQKMKKRGDKEMRYTEFINVEVAQETGGFFRKGENGDGKLSMTEIQKMKMDIWIKRNTIGKTEKYSQIIYF